LVAVLSMVLLNFIATTKGAMLGIGFSEVLTDRMLSNSAWRLLMISGALPALMIFFILLFVPESEKWKAEQRRGATTHWAKTDLLGVLLGSFVALGIVWAWSPVGVSALPAIGITLAGLAIALFGYLHPVRKYLVRAEQAGTISDRH